MENISAASAGPIAIIGMACKLPDAPGIDAFWDNLVHARPCITRFGPDEAGPSFISPVDVHDGRFVGATGLLEDADKFDARFFGYTPREAEIIDPQQRVLLECAWTCLEHAGHAGPNPGGMVGVYAAASTPTYLIDDLLSAPAIVRREGAAALVIANDKDYAAARISHKLDFRGPSVTVQSACSSSLLAVHLACTALRAGECDMALAGGVCIRSAQRAGHIYRPGGFESADGACRPFDAAASGTIWGNGAGMVLLKPLDAALRDRDRIYAVILGSAATNDGAGKAAFTSPTVAGQAAAVARALAIAGVSAEAISYVETHGTGTPVGDPIEIEALTQAFRAHTDRRGYCRIGTLKSMIGHLDAASGVVGLIKTILVLDHEQIPASLGYETPNPSIRFENTPFYVNTTLVDWPRGPVERIAGVSAFGVGGGNVHVILKEGPPRTKASSKRRFHLLPVSARSEQGLREGIDKLCSHLALESTDIGNAAFTLQQGRRAFEFRSFAIAEDVEEAVDCLERCKGIIHRAPNGPPELVFLFPGQGAQFPGMLNGLYQDLGIVRECVDKCCDALAGYVEYDIRGLITSAPDTAESRELLDQTACTQPALFVAEYALADLWMHWGVRPASMIGHSIGEYVAATISGVFDLTDALRLVALRGKLIQGLPPGAMLVVHADRTRCGPLFADTLDVAAVNTPGSCVLSGAIDDIEQAERLLVERGVACRRIRVSHAFHSRMVETILEEFEEHVAKLRLSSPKIPFVSNVTGDWITPALAMSPRYWSDHIRSTVKFSEGILKAAVPGGLFLEIGPGDTLTRAAQAHLDRSDHHRAVSSLPAARTHALRRIDHALGTLWCNGVAPDWNALHDGEQRHRVPLPTYSFQRERYWITPPRRETGQARLDTAHSPSHSEVSLFRPVWKRISSSANSATNWGTSARLVFSDGSPLASETEKQLSVLGSAVVIVSRGERFEREDANTFRINPARREDFALLFEQLNECGCLPGVIVYFSGHGREGGARAREIAHKNAALYGPLFLAQVLTEFSVEAAAITIITRKLFDVLGSGPVRPEESLFLGPAKVIPLEYKNLTCELVDVSDDCDHNHLTLTAAELINGTAVLEASGVSAVRFGRRWRPAYETVTAIENATCPFREGGVYLITGGLGALGLIAAEAIATRVNATILLASRTALPARADWSEWPGTHTGIDTVSEQISAINRIETVGSTVETFAVDVSNERDVRELAESIQARFGALHGIIHAAGSASGKTIHACSAIGLEPIVQTKVEGVKLLAEVFDLRALDFVAFYSSISSIAPAPGQMFYASANAFMDAFARTLRSDGVNAISINWDAWKGAGMAQRFVDEHGGVFGVTLENAISPEEGADAFVRALTVQGPQLVACRGEVEDRGRYSAFVSATADRRPQSHASHPRPDLGVEFVAPESLEEDRLAALWEECLGIGGIGVNDNFFDLGGHSLLFAGLAELLAERHDIAAPLSMFYECKTIAEQAQFIRDLPAGPSQDRMPAMTPLRGQTTTG